MLGTQERAATAPAIAKTPRPLPDPRRTYLKIKIVSLAAEARLIRAEERRWPGPSQHRIGLRSHRLAIVRVEARAALLAYGFIRGRRYRQLEATAIAAPNWKRVYELVTKYGPVTADLKARFEAWVAA